MVISKESVFQIRTEVGMLKRYEESSTLLKETVVEEKVTVRYK